MKPFFGQVADFPFTMTLKAGNPGSVPFDSLLGISAGSLGQRPMCGIAVPSRSVNIFDKKLCEPLHMELARFETLDEFCRDI